MLEQIANYLDNDEMSYLLEHQCKTISKKSLYERSGDFVDKIMMESNRSIPVQRSMQQLIDSGRLAGSGYISILPVDQGIEHSAGSAFAKNPIYFDSQNIVKLAIEGGCNAVCSSLGVLSSVARRYAHHIPFILKLNHNELLSYPNQHEQILFSQVKQAFEMGCIGVGATIYFGSVENRSQIAQIANLFEHAHKLGMLTILWCYLRNSAFKQDKDYHLAADLTGQANHLGVSLGADIIKQKLPENNGGYLNIQFGKTNSLVYSQLSSDHPIDLTRYQVANCYMGRIGLINSGGASQQNDFQSAIRTAIINKRAGGAGLIMGRKAFQRPMKEGVKLIHLVQDIYLCPEIDLA